MNDFQSRVEKHRKALYAAVKAAHPDLYRRAVEVGHLAMADFGGADELKRSATVEAAAMSLVAKATGIIVELPA